ncbi:hypothetical protein ABZ934_12185 [Streptomyces sp. NPDC046557]|uniref:hypothetical protein n=1 Tax=Streptomyces sp. NPDC046557 TaxID=3155372 RepID=UPI0033D4078A
MAGAPARRLRIRQRAAGAPGVLGGQDAVEGVRLDMGVDARAWFWNWPWSPPSTVISREPASPRCARTADS